MHPDQYLLKEMKVWSFENILSLIVEKEFTITQAGTELCQAQLKLASSLKCFRVKDDSGS